MNYDTHELAWAAGFFDGEGHARFNHGYRGRSTDVGVRLGITQKTPALLHRFIQAVGKGKVYGPYTIGKTGSNVGRFTYRLELNKYEDVEFVSELLAPWLGPVKLGQIRSALISFRGKSARFR